MSQQSINGYENNGIEPDISTLTHIADYFQTSVDYIIGRTAIRHIYSEMDEHALTVRELELIQNYRLLPEVSRRIIDELIEDMSDRHIAGYSLT